jgi:ubiquinone/menaquinone biosynthesis C-methylase UbiE
MEKRRGFFDDHAHSWDRDLGYEEKLPQIEEIVARLEIAEKDSVLDVGTGTGILIPFIAKALGPNGRLAAIDFSFRMLMQANCREFHGCKPLVNASVESIPFPTDEFDRIVCFSAFPHFPNKSKALLEMVRVLKAGGSLFIAHLHSVEEINQLHRGMGGAVAHDSLPLPGRIRGLMQESGLYEIAMENRPGRFLARGRKI